MSWHIVAVDVLRTQASGGAARGIVDCAFGLVVDARCQTLANFEIRSVLLRGWTTSSKSSTPSLLASFPSSSWSWRAGGCRSEESSNESRRFLASGPIAPPYIQLVSDLGSTRQDHQETRARLLIDAKLVRSVRPGPLLPAGSVTTAVSSARASTQCNPRPRLASPTRNADAPRADPLVAIYETGVAPRSRPIRRRAGTADTSRAGWLCPKQQRQGLSRILAGALLVREPGVSRSSK